MHWRGTTLHPSRRRPTLVRPAAYVASGFKSRSEDLCKCSTSDRKRRPLIARSREKGPIQTPARNESERESAVREGEPAEDVRSPAQETRHVIGAGMVGRGTYVNRGGLGGSGGADAPSGTTGTRLIAEAGGASEESERLIVAWTPSESWEQRRGRSQEGRVTDHGASDR